MTRVAHIEITRTRHGRRTIYFRYGKGPRIRMPDDMSSKEFSVAYKAACLEQRIEDVRHMPATGIERRKQMTETVLRRSLRGARTRSTEKNLPFDLDLDFILLLASEQECRCALTGIEFFAHNEAYCRIDPYTPSIDRIVPSLGYVKGNVRLVIFAVNAMLLDWGEPLFIKIANSYRYWNHWTRRTKTVPITPVPFLPPHPKKNALGKTTT